MRITISLILFFMSLSVSAQNPVNWKFSAKKTTDTTYEIHLTATVSTPWHIYSQNTPEGGPVPTKISFVRNPLVSASGQVKEVGKLTTKHEEVFGIDVEYFDGTVDFVQVVKVKRKLKTSVNGTVTYMVCNDQQCLPPATVSFSVKLN